MFRCISSVQMLTVFFMNRCWILSRCFYAAFIEMIGEGNGNPLQYSCLENPRDRGAWWAAIYGVTQSRTQLQQLSSSSSSSRISNDRISGSTISAPLLLSILPITSRWPNLVMNILSSSQCTKYPARLANPNQSHFLQCHTCRFSSFPGDLSDFSTTQSPNTGSIC